MLLKLLVLSVFAILVALALANGQNAPKTLPIPQTFAKAIEGTLRSESYTFGTRLGRSVRNLASLAEDFSPYGIAGRTVVNGEWDLYQPFNDKNFVFTDRALNLTATMPAGGGLFPGGIHSAQICTKETFKPGQTGHQVYAFEVRMKIPSGQGMWPAAWFYTQQPGQDDGSEIDNPEIYVMKSQNQFDWTGFQHGPGQGAEIYSIKTNQYVWHGGVDFSADYHNFQTLWTPDAVYKYVDGVLIYAQAFKWTAPGAAQLLVTLAVGGDAKKLPGLQPTSLSEFPSALSVQHIMIWTK